MILPTVFGKVLRCIEDVRVELVIILDWKDDGVEEPELLHIVLMNGTKAHLSPSRIIPLLWIGSFYSFHPPHRTPGGIMNDKQTIEIMVILVTNALRMAACSYGIGLR